MERCRSLPCPANLLGICEAPGGPHLDQHHETPKRFFGMARLQNRSKEYRNKLWGVITHPMNKIEICWCLHHKYGLEAMIETQLPSQQELDGKLDRWKGQ